MPHLLRIAARFGMQADVDVENGQLCLGLSDPVSSQGSGIAIALLAAEAANQRGRDQKPIFADPIITCRRLKVHSTHAHASHPLLNCSTSWGFTSASPSSSLYCHLLASSSSASSATSPATNSTTLHTSPSTTPSPALAISTLSPSTTSLTCPPLSLVAPLPLPPRMPTQ